MSDANVRRIRAKLARTPLRLPVRWLRHRGLAAEDIFLASYPRSGNTWLRFVLGEATTGKSITFDNVDEVIPELRWHRRGQPIFEDGGRLIKTHEPWRREYRKAIYIVRDPRDVALSQFARSQQLGIVDANFDNFLPLYLQGQARVHPYGTWAAHVRSWLDSSLAREGKLLVVRFEDLRLNPEEELSRMVRFVNVPATAETIRTALANNSVEQMRAKEVKSQKLYQSTTEVGRFVRKGAVQGWRSALTPAQQRLFEQYAGPELSRMGYPSGSEVPSAETKTSLQTVGS
jgi:hypothetical protein